MNIFKTLFLTLVISALITPVYTASAFAKGFSHSGPTMGGSPINNPVPGGPGPVAVNPPTSGVGGAGNGTSSNPPGGLAPVAPPVGGTPISNPIDQ